MSVFPLVSVVMPSYNQCGFIGASIDSVLSQTYPNIELIVADGASTDGTVAYLAERAAADHRLRWLSEKDGGPAEAINRALARVRGTYVGWLNSDDLYAPGAIRRAIDAFEAHPEWIMVYGHGRHVDAVGGTIGDYPTRLPAGPIERFADGCFICQPTVFFKKVMHTLIGDLDEGLSAAFDFDYWLRAFSRFHDRIGFVDAVQAMSRLHGNCITVKMRRRVAVEGVEVVARHLGRAPIHWLATYIDELLAQAPEERGIADLRAHLLTTVDELRDLIDPADYSMLTRAIRDDRRFQVSTAGPIARSRPVGIRDESIRDESRSGAVERNPFGNIDVRRMSEDRESSEESRLAGLRQVYDEALAPVVEGFYATIRNNEEVAPFTGEGLVGLLTFPNSGTSWFLRLTARASGLYNHTSYEKESIKAKGEPSRGAFSLRTTAARFPEPGEPSFIKSHVHYYGQQRVVIDSARSLQRVAEIWHGALPPNCDRYLRLVRNPLDNLRARYHLHLKDMKRSEIEVDPEDRELFRAFFRPDLRRYLQWHAYCDTLAATMPVMRLHYEKFLDPATAVEAIGRAMRFAGYRIDAAAIEKTLAIDPPKYVADPGVPLHLRHFDETDIRWAAAEIAEWVSIYAEIRKGRSRLVARLRHLVVGGRSPYTNGPHP